MLASLALLGFFLSHFKFGDLLSQHWIDNQVRGKGWTGDLLFLVVGTLATALAFPRQAVAFLGGYAFGFTMGTALSTLATVLGCVLDFVYARWIGRSFVQRRFPGRMRKLDKVLLHHPFSMALVIRLFPIGHNASTNLLAGVSSVRPMHFFAGSALGYLPQNLVFALAGSGVDLDAKFRLSLSIVLLVVSSLIGVWLYQRHRREFSSATEDSE